MTVAIILAGVVAIIIAVGLGHFLLSLFEEWDDLDD
jgi:hypothetical protein